MEWKCDICGSSPLTGSVCPCCETPRLNRFCKSDETACSTIFHDAPETAMYVAKNYNVRMFDAMMCFQKMAELERQRNIAVAALKSLASQSGHKSAPGCNCMDCQYIRPIEYAIRDATSQENVEPHPFGRELQPNEILNHAPTNEH